MSKIKARITSIKQEIGIWALYNVDMTKWPRLIRDTAWKWATLD